MDHLGRSWWGEDRGGIRKTELLTCPSKLADLKKCPCVRKTLDFHIIKWEDCCMEEAETR